MNRTPLDRLALIVVIIGALNWLLIGLFQYDLVQLKVLADTPSFFARIVYTVVGLAGLYTVSLLFREAVPNKE